MSKTQNRRKGNLGEEYAARYLENNGFRIIETNYADRFGEIDIVAAIDNTLCFIEVKTKVGDIFGSPEEMISKSKISRVQKMADVYINKNKQTSRKYSNYRIDVVAVVIDQNKNLERIDLYENVSLEFL